MGSCLRCGASILGSYASRLFLVVFCLLIILICLRSSTLLHIIYWLTIVLEIQPWSQKTNNIQQFFKLDFFCLQLSRSTKVYITQLVFIRLIIWFHHQIDTQIIFLNYLTRMTNSLSRAKLLKFDLLLRECRICHSNYTNPYSFRCICSNKTYMSKIHFSCLSSKKIRF